MTIVVKGGGRLLENYSTPLALSNHFPITPTKQTNDDEDDGGGSGDGRGRKTGKSPRKTRKGSRKKDSEKGVDTETRLKISQSHNGASGICDAR